jgi:hypothetical protein
VAGVFDIWGATEGKVGVGGLSQLSTHAADGLAVVESARAVRQRAEMDAARKEAARGR